MIFGLIGFAIALLIVYFCEKHAKPDKIDKYLKDKELADKKTSRDNISLFLKTNFSVFKTHIAEEWFFWGIPVECDDLLMFYRKGGYAAILTHKNGFINIGFIIKNQYETKITDSDLIFLTDDFIRNVIIPYQNKFPGEIEYARNF